MNLRVEAYTHKSREELASARSVCMTYDTNSANLSRLPLVWRKAGSRSRARLECWADIGGVSPSGKLGVVAVQKSACGKTG
jgi:hypothetical protein